MAEFINLIDITRRLRIVLDQSGMSAKEFSQRADISQGTLSLNLNEKQLINVATINKVIEHFPEIVDPYWFLFGDGASGGSRPEPQGKVEPEQDSTPDQMHELIAFQAEEIARLKKELESKKQREIERIMVFYSDNSFHTFSDKD